MLIKNIVTIGFRNSFCSVRISSYEIRVLCFRDTTLKMKIILIFKYKVSGNFTCVTLAISHSIPSNRIGLIIMRNF